MYRVALFGEPGSGKTTLAESLSEKMGIRITEASREVIFPMAGLDRFPKEQEAIDYLLQDKAGQASPTRRRARQVFSEIEQEFGGDFIAKVLHLKFVDTSTSEPCIFSGLRGLENAKYCRLHNDLVIYLKASKESLVERLMVARGYSRQEAVEELKDEDERYRSREIEKVADLVIDTSALDVESSLSVLFQKVEDWTRVCRCCVNTSRNPSIKFNQDGYCHICEAYLKHFDPDQLIKELELLESYKQRNGHQIMVGISGGKDSTATLNWAVKMGFRPLAFTFDTGYLPKSTIPRAEETARKMGVDHEVIDVRPYVRDIDHGAYSKFADLYDQPFTLETKRLFRDAYEQGRKHYSLKCTHSPTFARSCQICRRLVVRAYYKEATARGIQAIVLGMNEWTNLSASQGDNLYKVSGVRKLQPSADGAPVHIFHLPFLLRRTIDDVEKELAELDWSPPEGESLIESNSNSCLLARSAERMAKRLLEFHPDSTRLGREVTAGFITKEQALDALGKLHPHKHSPREVLERANILEKNG